MISISVGLEANKMLPVNRVFDTCIGPKIIGDDFLETE